MKRTGPYQTHPAAYSALTAKNVHSVLRQELLTNFGFEHMFMMADVLIERFLTILKECQALDGQLQPFQTVIFGYDRHRQFDFMCTPWQVHLKAVRVSIVTPEELARLAQGASLRELTSETAVRILKEAYSQGAILSFADVSLVMRLSPSAVATAVRRYKEAHPDDFVPHCGTVLDLGPTLTHKRPAILAYLQGYLTSEAARLIDHDPKAVDRYINDYERVSELAGEGKSETQISFLTKLSRHLVREHLVLRDEFNRMRTPAPAQEYDAPATRDIDNGSPK
ncbi:MAG: DUF1670 domain-containing protein [Planctomycetota bacterium]